jgi:hypothetical protein
VGLKEKVGDSRKLYIIQIYIYNTERWIRKEDGTEGKGRG